MATFLVIGLSNFGTVLACRLNELGENVLVIDNNKEKIQQVKDQVSQAMVADATDKKILEKAIKDTKVTAIICLGESIEKSVMVTYHLRQLEATKIISKADSEDKGKVLRLVGASEIINPEKDMASRLAETLHNPNQLDSLWLGEKYTIVESIIPEKCVDHSLKELNLRERYQVNVLAIKKSQEDESITLPTPDYVFQKGNVVLLLGKKEKVNSFISS